MSNHSSQPGAGGYLAALDGLRGLSVALVVFAHFGLGHIVPGGLGVTIFFFISGFIITRLMVREVELQGSVAYLPFYVRRFFRLGPALFVFVLVCNLVVVAFGRSLPWGDNLASLFYFANYWHLYFGWGGTTPENIYNPLAVLWSLAVEEHFYFVFPFLLTWLYGRSRHPVVALGVMIAAVLVWRCYLALDYLGVVGYVSVDRTYKSTDSRIDSILYGCLLSVIFALQDRSPALRQLLDRLSGLTSLTVGVGVLLFSLAVRDTFFRETLRYSLQGLALLLIFPVIFRGTSRVSGFLNAVLGSRLPVFIGKISYSLYLYHWLVFVAIVEMFPKPSIATQLAIGLPLSLLLAYLSWRWVEQPLRRTGHELATRLAEPGALKDRAPSSS